MFPAFDFRAMDFQKNTDLVFKAIINVVKSDDDLYDQWLKPSTICELTQHRYKDLVINSGLVNRALKKWSPGCEDWVQNDHGRYTVKYSHKKQNIWYWYFERNPRGERAMPLLDWETDSAIYNQLLKNQKRLTDPKKLELRIYYKDNDVFYWIKGQKEKEKIAAMKKATAVAREIEAKRWK